MNVRFPRLEDYIHYYFDVYASLTCADSTGANQQDRYATLWFSEVVPVTSTTKPQRSPRLPHPRGRVLLLGNSHRRHIKKYRQFCQVGSVNGMWAGIRK